MPGSPVLCFPGVLWGALMCSMFEVGSVMSDQAHRRARRDGRERTEDHREVRHVNRARGGERAAERLVSRRTGPEPIDSGLQRSGDRNLVRRGFSLRGPARTGRAPAESFPTAGCDRHGLGASARTSDARSFRGPTTRLPALRARARSASSHLSPRAMRADVDRMWIDRYVVVNDSS